jgi:hypothetical protein
MHAYRVAHLVLWIFARFALLQLRAYAPLSIDALMLCCIDALMH